MTKNRSRPKIYRPGCAALIVLWLLSGLLVLNLPAGAPYPGITYTPSEIISIKFGSRSMFHIMLKRMPPDLPSVTLTL